MHPLNYIALAFSFYAHTGIIQKDTVGVKDLEQFWQSTRQQLSLIPIEPEIEATGDALPYKQYKITVKSLGGVTIAAWLSIPVQGEAPAAPWPVIITNPGYGASGQQGVMLSECQRGYAIIQMFPRGQGGSARFWDLQGADKLS